MNVFLPSNPPHTCLSSDFCLTTLILVKGLAKQLGAAQVSAFKVSEGKGTGYCVSPLLGCLLIRSLSPVRFMLLHLFSCHAYHMCATLCNQQFSGNSSRLSPWLAPLLKSVVPVLQIDVVRFPGDSQMCIFSSGHFSEPRFCVCHCKFNILHICPISHFKCSI